MHVASILGQRVEDRFIVFAIEKREVFCGLLELNFHKTTERSKADLALGVCQECLGKLQGVLSEISLCITRVA